MKALSRILVIFLFFFALNKISIAQESKREFSVTGGYATRIFDTDFEGKGSGFYLGLNLYKRNASGFTTDAQLSMNFISEDNSSSNILSISALYGIRYYFNSPESNTHVFFNSLVGPAFKSEQGDDFTENLIDIGFSAGVFIAPKRWLFGVSVDNPTNLVFKVGYRF